MDDDFDINMDNFLSEGEPLGKLSGKVKHYNADK